MLPHDSSVPDTSVGGLPGPHDWTCGACDRRNGHWLRLCLACGTHRRHAAARLAPSLFGGPRRGFLGENPVRGVASPATEHACGRCGEEPVAGRCRCDRPRRGVPSTLAMDILELDWVAEGVSFDRALKEEQARRLAEWQRKTAKSPD